MKPEIDVDKIRELLEMAKKAADSGFVVEPLDEALSLLLPLCSECQVQANGKVWRCDKHKQGIFLKLLSKPCKTCGGSGEITPMDEAPRVKIPCPACQAPAGEIEEFVKELWEYAELTEEASEGCELSSMLHRACTHLTAQAKQIKELRKREEIIEDMPEQDEIAGLLIVYAAEDELIPAPILLLAAERIQQLEGENNETKGLIDHLWCEIKKLRAKVEQLEGEVLELMLEMVKGSKGERQRINAELLEKRREDFGIQKGEA